MSSVPEKKQLKPNFDTSVKRKLVVKTTVVLSLVLLASVLASAFLHYQKNVQLILKNLQNQLQLAANTIATSIDGDKYAQLEGESSRGSSEYEEIRQVLEQFMVNRYLGFEDNDVYTFRRISRDSLEFTVMLHDQYVGNRYGIRKEMLPTLERGIPSYTNIYSDENGTWVSAYAPIVNSAGQVVGMVEVDFKSNVYSKAVKNEIQAILLLTLVAILLSILVAVLVSRRIARPLARIARAAIRLSKGDLSVNLSVNSNDEIGLLARAFNYMVDDLRNSEFIRHENAELTDAYRKLTELNKSLAEANRLKSEFLSIAAHDLKSPLQVIMGYSEMISDTPGLSSEMYRNAHKISHAIRRMLNLVNHLLQTTALDSGMLSLNMKQFDLEAAAQQVIRDNLYLAEQKDQTIDFQGGDDLKIVGDPERVHEIIDNLINNAIKFSPPGKKIEITLTASASANGKPGAVILAVKDHGPGLTKEDQRKLFRRFVRLSAVPTGGESSTGLGLSITRRLIELHGGRIWAQSEGKGRGSTFFIEFKS